MLYNVEGLPDEEEGRVGQHRHWDHREERKPGMCWWEVWWRGEQTEVSHLQGRTLSREHRGPSKELEWRAAPNRFYQETCIQLWKRESAGGCRGTESNELKLHVSITHLKYWSIHGPLGFLSSPTHSPFPPLRLFRSKSLASCHFFCKHFNVCL